MWAHRGRWTCHVLPVAELLEFDGLLTGGVRESIQDCGRGSAISRVLGSLCPSSNLQGARMLTFLALSVAIQSHPTLSGPAKSPESDAMAAAAAAIISKNELEMRARIAAEVRTDPDFDDFHGLRGPDRFTLEAALRAIKSCDVGSVMRSDAAIPTYTVNWICQYQSQGTERSRYSGAAAVLKWHEGRPTLFNFNFQGPWPRLPRAQ